MAVTKQAYTQLHLTLNKLCKGLKKTQDEAIQYLWNKSIISQSVGDLDLAQECSEQCHRLVVERDICNGHAMHMFMPDKNFCDWLVDSTKEITNDCFGVLTQVLENNKAGVLHFRTCDKTPSIYFNIVDDIKYLRDPKDPNAKENVENVLVIGYSYEFVRETNLIGASVNFIEDESASNIDNIDKYGQYFIKLVIGLSSYMNCFPEAAIGGCPEDLKHPSHHKYINPFELKIVDEVRHFETKDGERYMTPHFRTGHFRTFRNERFVNMRFQTIWIEKIFVKGKAKTVLDPEHIKD